MDDPSSFLIPAGAILNRDITTIHDVDMNAADEIQEYVSHSFYDYADGKDAPLHPYDGETNLNYTGPAPPYQQLDVDQSYSWLKSPRWKGHAMEVGPLARVLMLYAKGHDQTRELVNMTLNTLDVPVTALFSTLGRTAARGLETKVIGDMMQTWYNNLVANIKAGDTRTFNEKLWEPSSWPRRRVAWVSWRRRAAVLRTGSSSRTRSSRTTRQWYRAPGMPGRATLTGQPGAYEAALQDNHTLHDPQQPIEILRTIHSFDPCIACAVHVTDPDGEELIKVKVR